MNKYQKALEVFCENTKLTQFNIGQLQWASEELQELVDKVPYYEELEDKATPKKPILTLECEFDDIEDDEICAENYYCKVCNNSLDTLDKFCSNCGQALDWSQK